MKKLTQLSLIATAALSLSCVSAFAQMLTLSTVEEYEGSIQSFNNNQTLTQTFTNVKGVESMTYRFVSNSANSNATTLEAYFYQWDTSTNRIVGSSLWTPVGSQVIPSSSGGAWQIFTDSNGNDYRGYDYTLTPSLTTLDPNVTYAMVIRAVSNSGFTSSTLIGLQNIPDDPDAFIYGVAYRLANQTSVNNLSTTSSTALSGLSDYGFQQITITPAPEPQTAAACFAALFVAGLVGRRLYQRRQQAAVLAPVAA